MTDNVRANTVDNYITSSRAAQLSGYSQDYVGQLCRSGSVECKRVAGEWQVLLVSLLAYKKRFSPEREVLGEQESFARVGTSAEVVNDSGHQAAVTESGKTYISSSDAAKRTGYSQDYIGQLARSGSVAAKKVGRKWFVEQAALEAHKNHNDGLLAAVQAGSVGAVQSPLIKNDGNTVAINAKEPLKHQERAIPSVTYKRDDGSLVPGISTDAQDLKEVFAPEVVSMPAQLNDGAVLRKDLRSKQPSTVSTHKIVKEIIRHKPANKDSTPTRYHADSMLTEPTTISSLVTTGLLACMFLASFVLLAEALLLPQMLQRHMTIVARSVGITLTKETLLATTFGSKASDLLSGSMLYQKTDDVN